MTSGKDIKSMSREELEQYCFALERKLEGCEKRGQTLAARLAKVTEERNWTRGLLSNQTIPPREKMAIYGARRVIDRKGSGEDGLTHVYREDIGKVTGLTISQVSDAFTSLEKGEVIDRKLKPHYDKDTGKHERHIFVALGDIAKNDPKAIEFGKKQGGRREKGKCQSCGSENIVVESKKRCTCTDCGSIHESEWELRKDQTEQDTEEEVF